MNGMILGAYEQAWRRSSSSAGLEEFPAEAQRTPAAERSSARWNAGVLIGFAAMLIALFNAGASYA